MTQDEKWLTRYNEIRDFIETNHINPSKYDDTERGLYFNWIKHNKKLLKAGFLKEERVKLFTQLLTKMEKNKRVNQYV